MGRAITATTAALLAIAGAGGCGGEDGEGLLTENALRACLAEGGIGAEPVATATSPGPGLGNVSADFRATTAEGVRVDVVVQGSEQKARRTAADVRAALQAFGASKSEVVAARNAIVVFARTPSDQALETTRKCLG